MITQDKHQPDFGNLLSTLSSALVDYSTNVATLIQYTSAPIESEEEVLERAEVMDQMMDTAKHENDIVLVFVNAIADRIEEFESNMEMPFISIPERLRGLMEIKNLKQSDFKDIAPQSVISDILNGKREVNLNQAKGFANYFGLPIDRFIAV
jgi:HTH-type transcriptional regulator/antitoxin HigA